MESIAAQTADVVKPNKKLPLFRVFLVVIFLILIALGSWFLYSKITDKFPLDYAKIEFSEASEKERFHNYIVEASKQKGSSLKKDYFLKAYHVIAIDYDQQPTADKREFISQFVKYLTKNNYSNGRLSVPCKEAECGAVSVFTDQLQQLKENIELSTSLTDVYKASFLNSIENASFANGEGENEKEFKFLSNIFFSLKDLLKEQDNDDLKNLALEVLNVMKTVDEQQYDLLEYRDLTSLEQ